jgi:hypothetical protein
VNVKSTYQLGLVVKIGGLGDAAGSVNKGWSSDEWSETARTVGPVETTKDKVGKRLTGDRTSRESVNWKDCWFNRFHEESLLKSVVKRRCRVARPSVCGR